MTYRVGDILSPRIDVTEPLGAELSDFCEAIKTSCAPRSSASLGVDVLRIIEATDDALAAHSPAGPGAAPALSLL
jgi:hypothetical protein